MLNKKYILIGGILLMLTGAALLLFSRDNEPVTTPVDVISATATPIPLPAEEQELVKKLSKDFSEKYHNYKRPDDPAYLQSLKPYLSQQLYDRIVADNVKASRYPNIPAQVSTITGVRLEIKDSKKVQAVVTLEATPVGGQRRTETATLRWEKQGERWQISEIETSERSDG